MRTWRKRIILKEYLQGKRRYSTRNFKPGNSGRNRTISTSTLFFGFWVVIFGARKILSAEYYNNVLRVDPTNTTQVMQKLIVAGLGKIDEALKIMKISWD